MVDLPLPGMLLKIQGFLPSVQNSLISVRLISVRQVYGSKLVAIWRILGTANRSFMKKMIRDVWLVLTSRVMVIPYCNIVSVQVTQSYSDSRNEVRSYVEVVGTVYH